MSCRTEKKSVSLCTERLVVHVNSYCICGLVLECESDIVLHTILCLVCFLNLCICLFEKLLMLRRDSHDKVCCTILVSHIVLSLNEVLCKCRTDLAVSVFVELEHTLWLCTISESLVCKSACKHLLLVVTARIYSLSEKLRSIECEALDLLYELRRRCILSKLLAFLQRVKTAEKVLEHT